MRSASASPSARAGRASSAPSSGVRCYKWDLGILAGAVLIAAAGSVETEMPGLSGGLSLRDVAIILGYATLMLGVCLLACVVPTRRALGVEPTDRVADGLA